LLGQNGVKRKQVRSISYRSAVSVGQRGSRSSGRRSAHIPSPFTGGCWLVAISGHPFFNSACRYWTSGTRQSDAGLRTLRRHLFFSTNNIKPKGLSKMLSAKIITLPASQDAPAYVWFHTKHVHAAGNTVTTSVKLPKTSAHDGMPVRYHASVTPSQRCAVSVTNQTAHLFYVTLTSLDATPLVAGSFSVLVIG
jgi:hypothetical protein